jgi:hypothetical protein
MKLKGLALSFILALLACMPALAQDLPVAYNFQTVNYPNDTFTQLLGINNAGVIAGYHGATVNKGFTLVLPNSFTNENFPGSAQTQVIGINNHGKTVGFYIDTNGNTHGFIGSNSTGFTKVDLPGTPFNQLLGVNDSQQAAGYFSSKADGTGPDTAYTNSTGGVFASLFIPASTSAQQTGINLAGSLCGFYVDANGVNHGWTLIKGVFKPLNFPGSTGTQALGLNNKGLVVGSYTDLGGNSHGFTYNTGTKVFQSIDDPNGIGTTVVNGVNDNGVLVGFYGTSPINSGFVATPQ